MSKPVKGSARKPLYVIMRRSAPAAAPVVWVSVDGGAYTDPRDAREAMRTLEQAPISARNAYRIDVM